MSGFTVAVVGATGLVGREMVAVLEERNFPVARLLLFQSRGGVAREFRFHGATLSSQPIHDDWFQGVDLALFAVDDDTARREAPRAVRAGTLIVDNSSAYRLAEDVPLVVPEVNGDEIGRHHGIIANPNCAMVLLALTLAPLDRAAGVRRVIASTYQSVSGAGAAGEDALRREVAVPGRSPDSPFPHPIAFNLFPHISGFDESGWCVEERKIRAETRKVLRRPDLDVIASVVRVPVFRGHSANIAVDLDRPLTAGEARGILARAAGLELLDDPAAAIYPTPLQAAGRDPVLVGRIRADPERPGTIHLWAVGDNLRKGAALNAVQIAELAMKPAAMKPAASSRPA